MTINHPGITSTFESTTQNNSTCALCDTPKQDNERLVKMYPCGHTFHSKCITRLRWNVSGLDCPSCGQNLEALKPVTHADTTRFYTYPLPINPRSSSDNKAAPCNVISAPSLKNKDCLPPGYLGG